MGSEEFSQSTSLAYHFDQVEQDPEALRVYHDTLQGNIDELMTQETAGTRVNDPEAIAELQAEVDRVEALLDPQQQSAQGRGE